MQLAQEEGNVFRVKSGGWLVKKIESVAVASTLKLVRQLDALSFATTEFRGRLTQRQISQSDLAKGVEAPRYSRDVREKASGLVHSHCQDFGNVLASKEY
jgi:hypothetical protein